ncbi:MAG TPA: serine hydrolase domain-containing protein [Gemmatimonadales bacterium]
MTLLSAAALVAAAPLYAQGSDNRAARMDSIFTAVDRTGTPGCAAGAVQNGRFLHARGYGMADLERGAPITPQSVFYMGSVSKQFTAMSVALLSKDGTLSLDDPARKYLPEIPEAGAAITIRHMVHHMSGLREKWDLLLLSGYRAGNLVVQQDVLDLVKQQRALNFPPGTDHLYNNTAYDLLANVVQRASGKSLREFAAERIFRPLGMTRSLYVDDRTLLIPGRAAGYSTGGGRITVDNPNVETVGSGSVYSTLEDMARWDESFYTGSLGGEDLLRLVQTPGKLNDGTPLTYAFGLVVDSWRGQRRVQHGGALAGFRTQITRFPEQHFSAIVLCNFAQANPAMFADRIAEVYLAEKLAAAPARPARSAERPAFENAELAGRAAGIYRSTRSGAVIRLEQEGPALLYVMGSLKLPLTASGPDRARIPSPFDGDLLFDGPAGKPVTGFQRNGEPPHESYRRAGAPVTTPAALGALTGQYRSPELGVTWTIALKDTALIATAVQGREVKLMPAFQDGFTLEGSTVEFVRDGRGRVVALLLTPGRSRNLRFERAAGR